ncbi:MAG: hypothetical protein H6Q70_744 [Firmicutes bacterium]|nr:hypothetical protein [Bacillota bacterium]
MDKKIVFMFSGQGSQFYNMGKSLYIHDQKFRDTIRNLNDIIYKFIGVSVLNELYGDDKKSKSIIFKISRKRLMLNWQHALSIGT